MYDGHQLNDIMNSTTSKIFNDDEEQTSTSLFEGETLRFHMEAPPFYLSLPYNFTSIERYRQRDIILSELRFGCTRLTS